MLAGRMPSQGYHNVFKDWRLPKGFTLIYDVVCRRRKHTQLRDLKPDLRKAFESQSTLNLEEWIESCAMIYRHGCKPCINNQRFCTTENKYMGLFPKDTQVGDLVCVLFGCGMPVILRPYKDGYQFIGEAYVHGWMDGEAMRRYYFGKLSAKTFKIY
jgi:hypothetical protein